MAGIGVQSMNMLPTQLVQGGYNNALNSLNSAQQLNNQTASGEQSQAQQQLQQNQGKVQQGLINSGLGNTTVAQTMQQAPLQTYNTAMQNIQNAQAQRGIGLDTTAAGTQAAQGTGMAQQYMAMLNSMIQQGQPMNQSNATTATQNNAPKAVMNSMGAF